MTASATVEEASIGSPSPVQVAGIWVRHLVSLLFPLTTLAFLWTGPHRWYIAPLFAIPIGIAYHLDTKAKVERRQPHPRVPAWPFDGLLYLLAALQFLVIIELARMFSSQGFFSIDMAMVVVIVGGNSGFSIITAHELIHRRKRWEQQLGRLLLCTVLNEHFYTEHLRGHHVRVGLSEDPATARFGESYEAFYRRTIVGQWKSGWELEATRLGDPDMKLFDRRMLGNRMLHGLAVGWGLALVIYLTWGSVALLAFLVQALLASRLLEAVNYFEHWGLQRSARRVQPVDSWDTHAWFTYYGLTGLSRHADHHAYPVRPFQKLRVWEEAPMLPVGYVGMVDMVMGKNAEFQKAATAELKRCHLGPFADDVDNVYGEAPTTAPESARPGALRGTWLALPARLRRVVTFGTLIAIVTWGSELEAGAQAIGFVSHFALNAWIVVAFALALSARGWAQKRVPSEAVTWALAFCVLITLGRLTDIIVG